MDLIPWKEEFRRLVTSGVTPSSRFIRLGELTCRPNRIVHCKRGFYLFFGKTKISLLDTKSILTDLYTSSIFGNSYYDWEGNVLVDRSGEIINLETGDKTSGEFRELNEVINELFPLRMSFEAEIVESFPRRKIYIIYDFNEFEYYIVDVDRRKKEIFNETNHLYYYRGEPYSKTIWDDFLKKLWDRRILLARVTFSGHSGVGCVSGHGLIFFYNLISKVITVLNVKDLKLYSEEEFFSCNLPTEPFDCVWFTTVDGVLYILVKTGEKYQLITHR